MASGVAQRHGSVAEGMEDSHMGKPSSRRRTYNPVLAQSIHDLLHKKNELVANRLIEQQVREEDEASCCQKAGDCFRNVFL